MFDFIFLGAPGLPGSYPNPTPYPGSSYPSGPGNEQIILM